MRIAEVSTPELRQTNQEAEPHQHQSENLQNHILSQLESSIKHIETLSQDHAVPETLPSHLRQTLTQLGQVVPFLTNSLKLNLWKFSFRLWNACVDLSNAASIRSSASFASSVENIASLRHVAADLLYFAGDVDGIPSRAIKSSLFYHRTGLVWHDLKKFDLASTCFERATDLASKIDTAKVSDAEERKLLLDLNLARSRTAWEISDRNLAITLLNRTKSLLFGSPYHYKSLANQFLVFGKSLLSRNESDSFNEALRLMNEGLDLSEKGLGEARRREDAIELKGLRSKALRFIAAVHLQKGEYDSVIKCVKVLRDGNGGCGDGGDHASLPVLAMKAWLGIGKFSEAEKELRGMVINKDIPEGVWVAAVEAYFQAAGTAGAETTKGVFLGLLGRCHVSPKAAVRVVHRVLGDSCGEGSRIRAKVVAELASDERVVTLFAGEAAAKERKAMYAVLWNCASGNFQSKDYETSAEMFEKSMLYIPHDIENRILRAKGFRVLCLCYVALSQLDRAHEYIDEAQKLEPNSACAFLKFKIYLQRNDHSAAVNQIETMMTCLDFTPDFLCLSAHEAIACHALPVAVASLSNFLNFYSSGKLLPIAEVVVMRTLVKILTQDPGNEPDVLKFVSQAHTQASKLGPDCFFGKGEVGRRERNWFAVISWNLGTKCGKEKNFELCAEFLRLASEFFAFMDDGQAGENSVMVCKSLILSVSAMIASENHKKTALLDTEVKRAVELLDRAGKILSLISSVTGVSNDKITATESELFFMYTFNAYDIQGRLNNSESQQHLVRSFANSRACNPNHLLQIGLTASQGPRPNHGVATFALNECLSTFLSSSSPDYHIVALSIRKLITVASAHKGDTDDDAVHSLYQQAYRIMVGLREGEYPTEEGKWLAMTAWNRAALPVRLGQTDMAKKWMHVGLQLARKVPRMDTYRACMEDYVAAFEKKFLTQTGTESRPLFVT